jgi:hypothetical protein
MIFAACGLACLVIVGADAPAEEEPNDSAAARWLPVFDRVAAEYDLSAGGSQKLQLFARPVYKWTRADADGGNNGAIYVWTGQGCAEAVACFWRSTNGEGKLSVAHELHSLSPDVLTSERGGPNRWQPKAGVPRQVVPEAPVPAATATARLQQMRAIGRNFSARTVSSKDERTELRLLTQPLYRYESTNPDVTDGAMFAFVCTVGTDPEVFLLLESRATAEGPRWHYALARFSHMNLYVNYKGREVWQAVRDKTDTIAHSADNAYWLFHEPYTGKLP